MRTRRHYYPHRHAYAPRVFPAVVAAGALVGAVSIWLRPGWLVTALAAGAIGAGVAWVRWAIWRRRHPVVPLGEYLDLRRRSAPWN
jgi:hypothetical protein